MRRELSRRLDVMICHERFAQYKTAATEEDNPRSPSESARALLMRSVKSAFALLLTRVTEPRQPIPVQESYRVRRV